MHDRHDQHDTNNNNLKGTAMDQHTFFGTKIKVPFILDEEVVVTITEPNDKPVKALPLCAKPKAKVDMITIGNDRQASATVQIGKTVYRGFTIIENMFERDNFKVGNVYVGVPTIPDGNGGWKNRYRYRYMDQLAIAVRIAYLAARGVIPSMERYALEDRYGQTCSMCSKLQRPGRGNPDLSCRFKMDSIDMSELQKERYDVVDMGGGRYFQAFTTHIKDFNDIAKPWFRDVEALDSFFTSIAYGLADDLGLRHMLEAYPHFSPEVVIAHDSPVDDEMIDRESVRSLLEFHDKAHNLNGLVLRMAFDEALTREDYELYPKTIGMFQEHHIAEDKGYSMQFISNDMMDAYGVNGTCAYGTNDTHKNGYQTEQILMALDIRERLMELADPVIVTAHVSNIKDFSGFDVIDVRQALLAPSDDVDGLPSEQFIAGYVAELRTKFPLIKESLAEILKNDHILVVGQDSSTRIRNGVGFDIVDGKIVADRNMDIHARHVFAWVLSKLTKRHTLGVHNQ